MPHTTYAAHPTRPTDGAHHPSRTTPSRTAHRARKGATSGKFEAEVNVEAEFEIEVEVEVEVEVGTEESRG
ncbi:hypothetical protein [Streptomyces sp. NPDC093707]|uniref:hypothetical protein n=1 Tax=Streptomyces sp. NPDC093707 TaxID=3154984 RepID=UPI00344E5B6D